MKQKKISLPYIQALFEKTRAFLAANYVSSQYLESGKHSCNSLSNRSADFSPPLAPIYCGLKSAFRRFPSFFEMIPNYADFRGSKKKFTLISEIRGKRFAMYGSKKKFPLSVFMLLILTACAAQATPTPIELVEPVIMDTPTPKPGCSAIDIGPTPESAAARDAYFPPANAGDFSVGPADAPVTIVEYCEFQSEGCLNMALVIGQLMRDRDDVRFVFRPLPLIGILDKSERAVLAALAAGEQGKFWEMYDLLFIKQVEWKSLKPEAFDAWLVRESATLEVDVEKLEAAMNAEETAAKLQRMYESAKGLNIPAVPLILINDNPQPSYLLDYRSMSDTVGLTALGQKQFSQCPPFDIDPQKQYLATLRTEKGDIVMHSTASGLKGATQRRRRATQAGWAGATPGISSTTKPTT